MSGGDLPSSLSPSGPRSASAYAIQAGWRRHIGTREISAEVWAGGFLVHELIHYLLGCCLRTRPHVYPLVGWALSLFVFDS